MNKNSVIKLINIVGDAFVFGNDAGRDAYREISSIIDNNPSINSYEISLEGISATDASFPRESVVTLALLLRKEKGFYVTNFKSQEVIDNWSYAASAKDQPLLIVHENMKKWVGPKINDATLSLLDYIYQRNKITASQVSGEFNISIQNASAKLKKLFDKGYILGQKEVAESGGLEFVYRPIILP